MSRYPEQVQVMAQPHCRCGGEEVKRRAQVHIREWRRVSAKLTLKDNEWSKF